MDTESSIEISDGFIVEHYGPEEQGEFFRLFDGIPQGGDEDPTIPRWLLATVRPDVPAGC